MLTIQKYLKHYTRIWEHSPVSFPEFEKSYSSNDQIKKENNYEKFQAKIKNLQKSQNLKEFRKDPSQSFFPLFQSFLETVFDVKTDHLGLILSDEFKQVSKDFFYKARAFGPELSLENIYQAMRNVWIMNGIQFMSSVPVCITPSVFAYSMIYPYSDNFLDNPQVSIKQKQLFSHRFNLRLHGENIRAENFTEAQLFALVQRFEDEFSRAEFPEVYDSLYAIQKGQTDSLKMMGNFDVDEKTVRLVSFEKGGASVLADGYLVAGKLTPKQEQALFGYGIYLQLLDDIQDLTEDSNSKTKTIFSNLTQEARGEYVNKTIHFGRKALQEMRCFPGLRNKSFLDLMSRSIETMIIESVGLNHDWYNPLFLNELETHSPLSFSFVREKRAHSKSQRFALFQKYFAATKTGS